MPRKRTPKENSTDASTLLSELPADTAVTVAEPPAPDAPIATAELPASDTNGDGPSFAERVGQKQWKPTPDPFGIATDYQAGVRLFESKRDRQMAIQFGDGRPDGKPSQAVIDTMKDAGYRWNPSDRIWAHPVRLESAMTTRIEAKRLYHDICDMIRQEKGIAAGPEIPF